MFTPQRKGWPGWTPSPAKTDTSGKGMAILQPPPKTSLDENDEAGGGFVTQGEAEVWRRFRDAGVLDPSSIERKEREALVGRVSKFEVELYDCQYNMGLLLIEKNEWSSKYEDLKQALTEAEENIKREQTAHFVTLAEAQKREEACRKALVVEKQCVADLKQALHELYAESAEIQFTSDKKLAEARALVASVDEKSLVVEAKTHSAEARLAEANKKCLEAERKLQEVKAQESTLESKQASLKAEREVHEEVFSRERKNLWDWEKKMQEGQERLVEGQRLLNQREKMANEKDKTLKQKEKELEELRKKAETDLIALKDKKANISLKSSTLAAQEEEANSKRRNIEAKEKELNELQERLNARDSEGVQKIVDEHKTILEVRKRKFGAELDQTKESFEEDLKAKELEIDESVAETDRKEEKIMRREQLLENKEEKLKEKQKDLDTKSKALKELEKSVKKVEKDVAAEKDPISREKELLQKTRLESEKLQAAVEAGKLQIFEEKQILKVTEKERRDFQNQQAELRQVIEDNLLEKQSLIEQSEALKKEGGTFEKDWLVLDERGDDLRKEQEHVNEEKERLKKWVANEIAHMNHENQSTMKDIQREKEALRLTKEAFERIMEHERSDLREKSCRELEDELHDLELQINEHKRQMNFELELREKKFQDEMKDLLDSKERALRDITVQKDLLQKQMEEYHQGMHKLQKEMEELRLWREEIEGQRLEIQKDTDRLSNLSMKLKDQRESFAKEREIFFDNVEQLKHSIGEDVITEELARSQLQMQNFDDIGTRFLPSLLDGHMERANLESLTKMETHCSPGELGQKPNTPTHMAWLRKCATGLLNFSLSKRAEVSPQNLSGKLPPQIESRPGPSVRTGDMAADIPRTLPLDNYGALEDELTLSLNGQNYRDKAVEALTGSLNNMDHSQLLVSNNSKRKPGRKGKTRGINRNLSVKATINDAKAYLGEASGVNINDSSYEDGKASVADSQELSFDRDGATGLGQTLSSFATSDTVDHEVRSDSVSGRGRKRKPAKTVDVESPATKRYNLRRSAVASRDTTKTSVPRENKHATEKQNPVDVLQNTVENMDNRRGGVADKLDSTRRDASSHEQFPTSLTETAQGGLRVCETGNSVHRLEQSITEVHQFSHELVRVETKLHTENKFNVGTP